MGERCLYNSGDEIEVLDLIARFAFKSDSSISFLLGRCGDVINLADGYSFDTGPRGVFNVIGWLDVHHPCEAHIKAQLRVLLPEEYHKWEQMSQLVKQMFFALGIPSFGFRLRLLSLPVDS